MDIERKKRILLVNTRHLCGGGDSTYTFNLAALLRDKGHEVAFFAMQDGRNLADPNADLFVSHIDFAGLNRCKDPIAGLRVLARAIYSREARRKFRLMLERSQPDIVHLQGIHGHITPSVIFEAKKEHLPVVWTLHDYKLICPNTHYLIDTTGEICEACGRGRYYQAVAKRCKKGSFLASLMACLEAYVHRFLQVRDRVDAFLAPSAFLRNKLIERGFPADRVHHVPHFLPEDMFEDSGENHDFLLFFGKLQFVKGVLPLLNACSLVPTIRLILAGRVEEPLASELSTLLPPNARYVGMKHGEELLRLLRNALAVVVPSLWFENQPFSILEAFACGKPVIASDLGGMTELVGDHDRGWLVPPGNVQMLAEAMQWMTTHPKEAREMGLSAREFVRREHGAEKHYERIMQVYKHVIGAG